MSATGIDGAIIPISPWRVPGPGWKHPAQWVESSRLVAEPVELRLSRVERRRFVSHTTTRRGGADTAAVDWVFHADPPDPLFVVRRVGRLARIESFDGQPYSGLMTVEDATEALREALR